MMDSWCFSSTSFLVSNFLRRFTGEAQDEEANITTKGAERSEDRLEELATSAWLGSKKA